VYEVYVERSAERDLKRLSAEDFHRLIFPIKALAQNPRPSGCLVRSQAQRMIGVFGLAIIESFTNNEIIQRDKVSLDIFWLKDETLEDSASLPDPDVLARDIAENLESALDQFGSIYQDLEGVFPGTNL